MLQEAIVTTIKSIFIPEEIIIVENKSGQGYVVLPDKPKMLKSATYWATSYIYDYDIKDYAEREGTAVKFEGIVHKYKNGQFKLTLCESAANSWNGGKLSFWNCLITAPDNKEFLIGINQELLCNLLQSCTLVNGTVQQPVWLGRQKNNTGVYTETMSDFIQAKEEIKIKEAFKSKTTKYVVGDIVGSPSKQLVYAGVVYKHYDMQTSYDYRIHGYVGELTKLKEPEVCHLFIPYVDDEITPDWTYCENIRNKKTPYAVTGHVDYTAEELYQMVIDSRRADVLSVYSKSLTEVPDSDDVQNAMVNGSYGRSTFIVKMKVTA